ncbi:alpha/beta hydrolase fold protein [Podospora didyma]|uniref:Alpha/beta hydrolase fold protein n=1 Tax=Podospora didyma TaxID=330526 RepID=A0AAE0K027_9PEZI|nr:alpha/beta hydrolase fold protein [Podospora didyma]
MPFLTLSDGNSLFYKDWGNITGPPVVFSHGWPLQSDAWDNQMFFLGQNGYRTIAHDRRGHGRSSQPWTGNDMDTYADDLQQLFVHLGLTNATMVGHSTGGGEVVRYLGRHGTSRVDKAVLVGAIPPSLGAIPSNPDGVPLAVYKQQQQDFIDNRAQQAVDTANGPFFGFDRPDHNRSEGLVEQYVQQVLQGGFVNQYECLTALFLTDFTEDLKKMDIPTLLIHGDDDQLAPIDSTARKAAQILPNPTLNVYPGGDHGLPATHLHQVNQDLLDFIRGTGEGGGEGEDCPSTW